MDLPLRVSRIPQADIGIAACPSFAAVPHSAPACTFLILPRFQGSVRRGSNRAGFVSFRTFCAK